MIQFFVYTLMHNEKNFGAWLKVRKSLGVFRSQLLKHKEWTKSCCCPLFVFSFCLFALEKGKDTCNCKF